MLKRWNQAVLLVALAVQISGCAEAVLVGVGAAGGAGAVLWAKGRMAEKFDIPLSKVHTATLAALKDLDLPIKRDKI